MAVADTGRGPRRPEPAWLLWTWWRGDPLPALPASAGLTVGVAGDDREAARLMGRAVDDVRRLRDAGHRPYVARLDGAAVAFGWCATATALFGSPSVAIALPPGDRYLWGFATLPAWRGRGLYPRLLRAILVARRKDDCLRGQQFHPD